MIEQTEIKREPEAASSSDELNRNANSIDEPDVAIHVDGLTNEEAQSRLLQYGYNELDEKEQSLILKLLGYFWGPIPWMIEAAAVLSAVVGHWTDFYIVLTLLVLNAVVGFWEEHQAGNAIKALKSHLAIKARVKRSGDWKQIASRELVPGDVLHLRAGDIVPADVKLADDEEIEVDQSALTGESLPVLKSRSETLYSSSIVKKGEGNAVVFATGTGTYFGKTAVLVKNAETTSHFQKAVLKIGNFLILTALALVILMLAIELYRGQNFLTAMEFALILTVAAIPAAMPAVLSVTMAVGARKLAKKQAIVSRLASIEELAGVDVLCSDKTGTITKNELTLGEPFCLPDFKRDDVIAAAAMASRDEDQDPLDLAVLNGNKGSDSTKGGSVVKFIPFDPVHKRTEAEIAPASGPHYKVSKGAPQVILQMSANAAGVRSDIDRQIDEFASRGYRSIGVARTNEAGQWIFMGLIPLYDPPRDDSKETIERTRQLGISVKMITGDQQSIAREISRLVGLGTNIQLADIFNGVDSENEDKIDDMIEASDGFAQVYPEHKYKIVQTLQRKGHIVGMTGDGVNDAPALKLADAGIAVSGATDAARTAADIVLLNPGLSVIIDAINISRKIFHRMTAYAIYRITETIRVLFFMTLSILIYQFYPVTAAMIVLLAILNDGPILTMAYDRARTSAKPLAWKMKEVLQISTVLGIVGVIASFVLFFIARSVYHLDAALIQSIIFLKLAVAGHLTIFSTRTRGPFWSYAPSGALFWSAILTKALATLAAVYGILMPAIGWKWALFVWGYALVWFYIGDNVKLLAYRIFGRGAQMIE